ncbi:MAG: DmsE family decaheme c-type cytochrome [Nitrospinae bacterium]|nr:DmsE family decaheme c-type cytochrome [Nitrospinota bacterium]
MRNRGRRMLFAVLIPTLIAAVTMAVVALPSFLQGQVTLAGEASPKPAPPGFVGPETCKTCHPDQFERFSATTMGRLFLKHPRNDKEALGCETCHGPGKAHVESGGTAFDGLIIFSKKSSTPVEQRNAVCLQCHEKTARLYWQGSPHESRDLACTNCHKVMEQVSERSQLAKATQIETCGQCHIQRKAQLMRSSHMPLREGKMTCTDCHNPHGTATDKLLKANSVNETCYTCHTEKRGPFLWEHPPVTESCTNCHEPHGSNHEKLLKIAKPRLCQQCHVESRHPTRPQDPRTRFAFNRSCTNCHSQIHGSNHPSAAGRFQR